MLTAIFNVLPDWAVAIIIGGAIWFGINYTWFAPEYFERVITRQYCGVSKFYENSQDEKFDMAIYTSTIGVFGSERAIISRICREGTT